MTSTLHIQNLSVKAGTATLLGEVSLQAGPQQFLAIVGPNGAGKTTLFRALLGLTSSQSTRLSIGETPLNNLPARKRAQLLSWLPQHQPSAETITVGDRMLAARYRFHETRRESQEVIDKALAELNIRGLAKRTMNTLSGGEAQRVALAALATQQATWMLLDEPANHLDPAQQVFVYRTLGRLWAQGQGVMCITHDINLLRHVAGQQPEKNIHVVGVNAGKLSFKTALDNAQLADQLSTLFGLPVIRSQGERGSQFLFEAPASSSQEAT